LKHWTAFAAAGFIAAAAYLPANERIGRKIKSLNCHVTVTKRL